MVFVSNEERRFLHEVGLKLAVKPALTNDLLFAMEEHIGKELPMVCSTPL